MMLRNFQKEYCLGKAKLNNRTHSYSECTIPIEIDKKQKSHRFFNQWLFYSLYRGDKIVCAFLWFPFAGVQSFIQKHVRKRTNSFCFSSFSHTQVSSRRAKNKKATDFSISGFSTHFVGVTRFELATTRPPDAYSKPGWATPRTLSECKYTNFCLTKKWKANIFSLFGKKTGLKSPVIPFLQCQSTLLSA